MGRYCKRRSGCLLRLLSSSGAGPLDLGELCDPRTSFARSVSGFLVGRHCGESAYVLTRHASAKNVPTSVPQRSSRPPAVSRALVSLSPSPLALTNKQSETSGPLTPFPPLGPSRRHGYIHLGIIADFLCRPVASLAVYRRTATDVRRTRALLNRRSRRSGPRRDSCLPPCGSDWEDERAPGRDGGGHVAADVSGLL